MNTTTLSENAQKLLTAIKANNLWEEKAIEVLFPKPVYSKENQAEYWQHEANTWGNISGVSRPVGNESIVFMPNVERTFEAVTYDAVKELKAANLIEAKNAGYNTYYYKYIGK